jgi:hypothetical protein
MVVYLSMITPIVNAQNNTSFSQLQNATENTGVEEKSYIRLLNLV